MTKEIESMDIPYGRDAARLSHFVDSEGMAYCGKPLVEGGIHFCFNFPVSLLHDFVLSCEMCNAELRKRRAR